jgi:DNA polymerase-3 subunit epsilon
LTTTLLNFYLSNKSNAERSKELLALLNDAIRIEWSSEKTFPDIPKSKTTQKHWRKTSTNSQIMEIIKNMMPDDLLGDNPEEIELSYAQTLLEALEDGVISTAEVSALNELASSLNVTTNMQLQIHAKIMRLLVEESWKDGVVSKSEQAEITSTGESLGFSETDSKLFIKEIEELRASIIGANSKKLPDNWDLGEPLLVGDRVVITGCYEAGRTELENQAKALGVKITGAISGKTSMLVSDGTIGGNKDNDAKKLGVRTVSPEVFRELLKFVQPKSVDG